MRSTTKSVALLILVLAGFWPVQPVCCQALTGLSGLVSVPTAEILDDLEFAVGINFLNRKHLTYFNGRQHTNAYFVTMGFLPFLELGLRYSRALDPGPGSVGDRMVSARFQIVNERKVLPAVVIGVHDLFSNVGGHFNALYGVASKQLSPQLGLHLGYGVNWLNARNHEFVGLFGGVSWSPVQIITFMLENDGQRFNGGLRFYFFQHIGVLVGFQNFDSLSGGLSYHFRL